MSNTRYVALGELNIDCIELKVLNSKALDAAINYKAETDLLYEKLDEFGGDSYLVEELRKVLGNIVKTINETIEEIKQDGMCLDTIHSKIRKM